MFYPSTTFRGGAYRFIFLSFSYFFLKLYEHVKLCIWYFDAHTLDIIRNQHGLLPQINTEKEFSLSAFAVSLT